MDEIIGDALHHERRFYLVKAFSLNPEIHKFDTFEQFSKDFILNSNDLIVASKSTYTNSIQPLNLNLDILFPGDYGRGEPSTGMIDNIIKDIKAKNYKRIIAVGGGTVLDIAKILALKAVENSRDVFEKKKTFQKDKELIMIPTTCGTGSEVTCVSVAEIEGTNSKLGVGLEELYADYAVLIPELLNNLPYSFFAFSSLDALIHASESFLSPKSSSYTELFSEKAIQMILKGYLEIASKGGEARFKIMEDFLIASNYAGIAFGNAGVGAVHALSYPLGGKYHVAHGESNYEFFIEVFRTYNKFNPTGKITKFFNLVAACLNLDIKNENDKNELVLNALEELLNKIWTRKNARDFGMQEDEIKSFALDVFAKQQRLLSNNYEPFKVEDIESIYRKVY